jgi:repressor LexA
MNFGHRLRQLRKEKHMTQAQLAQQFNLAESTISLYENNKRNPDYHVLLDIARFFNVSADYLIGRSPQKHSLLYAFAQDIPVITDIHAERNLHVFTDADGRSLFLPVKKETPFWFRVRNDTSQMAGILTGDLLLIEPCRETVYNGALYLVMFGSARLEACRLTSYEYLLIVQTLDPSKKPRIFSDSNQEKFRVIGKILELNRSYTDRVR